MKNYNSFKKILLSGLLILIMLVMVSCNKSNDDSSTIVFKNVNVIPMNTEIILVGYNVIIEDGKIIDLGKSKDFKIPKDVRIIDANDKYLTPGLVDMHVHYWYKDDLTFYLANGVTTIRDMFGNPNNLEIKKQIEEGDLLGPRFYVASPIMDGSPQYGLSQLCHELLKRQKILLLNLKTRAMILLKYMKD